MAYLYSLTAPNGKAYLGITNYTPEKRWQHHLYSALSNSKLAIHCAIRKYGWDNFKKEILVEGSFAYVKELEIKAIAVFNSFAPAGYNLTKGGDGTVGRIPSQEAINKTAYAAANPSDESRKKMSDAKKAAWSNPTHRINMMQNRPSGVNHQSFGKPNAFRGQKHTQATKDKISKGLQVVLNKVYTCPHCNKSGGFGLLAWHFDHCKFNVENV